ncbi:MAG: SH3 domain-containing protein [Spirochaetales bacterium]|nr:SH3 domain-containing protein [Spirochaetales bacterium]
MTIFFRALIVFFLSGPLWGQSFELVKSFPMGSDLNELGLQSLKGDPDGSIFSSALMVDTHTKAILDGVNKRVVFYDSHWQPTKNQALFHDRGYNLTPTYDGLLLWDAGGGAQITGGIEWVSFPLGTHKNVDLTLKSFVESTQQYVFLFQYKDVLIFQNVAQSYPPEKASYFGIRGLATTKDEPQTYLDDTQVRALLADPANTRYKVTGNIILDENQLVSVDGKSAGQFFSDRGAGKWTQNMGNLTRPAALANGNYWFANQYNVNILDSQGQSLVEKQFFDHLVTDVTLSEFFPAPDGYLYQLRGDYAHKETRLYRIGPFPEIKLDYHGRGGTITEDHVNLRESPAIDGAIITQLDKGTPVRILDQTKKPQTIAGQTAIWYKVLLWDRTEGWMFGAFLGVGK